MAHIGLAADLVVSDGRRRNREQRQRPKRRDPDIPHALPLSVVRRCGRDYLRSPSGTNAPDGRCAAPVPPGPGVPGHLPSRAIALRAKVGTAPPSILHRGDLTGCLRDCLQVLNEWRHLVR